MDLFTQYILSFEQIALLPQIGAHTLINIVSSVYLFAYLYACYMFNKDASIIPSHFKLF